MCKQKEKPAKQRPCQWCGEAFVSSHRAKLYCSPKCKASMASMFTVIGKRVAADAMYWRLKRGKAGGPAAAFQRLCWLLDEANREFKQVRPKGAPSIEDYVASRNKAAGVRFGQDR